MKKKIFFLSLVLLPVISWARHPMPGDMESVKLKAHELETQVIGFYNRAVSYSYERHHRRYHNRWNEYALEHVRVFKDAARHFHSQVEAYFKDPAHTEHDYIRLIGAFRDAESTLHDLNAYRYDYDMPFLWSLVQGPMRDLSSYYEGEIEDPYDPHHPHNPHQPVVPVSVDISKVEVGGSFSDTVVRIQGSLLGPGIKTVEFAGVYVNGQLEQTLDPFNPFYVRLKWARFSGHSHRVEIRVRLHHGYEQTVWVRDF